MASWINWLGSGIWSWAGGHGFYPCPESRALEVETFKIGLLLRTAEILHFFSNLGVAVLFKTASIGSLDARTSV